MNYHTMSRQSFLRNIFFFQPPEFSHVTNPTYSKKDSRNINSVRAGEARAGQMHIKIHIGRQASYDTRGKFALHMYGQASILFPYMKSSKEYLSLCCFFIIARAIWLDNILLFYDRFFVAWVTFLVSIRAQSVFNGHLGC